MTLRAERCTYFLWVKCFVPEKFGQISHLSPTSHERVNDALLPERFEAQEGQGLFEQGLSEEARRFCRSRPRFFFPPQQQEEEEERGDGGGGGGGGRSRCLLPQRQRVDQSRTGPRSQGQEMGALSHELWQGALDRRLTSSRTDFSWRGRGRGRGDGRSCCWMRREERPLEEGRAEQRPGLIRSYFEDL